MQKNNTATKCAKTETTKVCLKTIIHQMWANHCVCYHVYDDCTFFSCLQEIADVIWFIIWLTIWFWVTVILTFALTFETIKSCVKTNVYSKHFVFNICMIVCISIFHVNQLLHYQIAHYLTFAQIFESLLVKAELFGSKSVLTQLLTVSNVSVNVDAICFLRYVIYYRSQTKSNSEPNYKSNDLRYSL